MKQRRLHLVLVALLALESPLVLTRESLQVLLVVAVWGWRVQGLLRQERGDFQPPLERFVFGVLWVRLGVVLAGEWILAGVLARVRRMPHQWKPHPTQRLGVLGVSCRLVRAHFFVCVYIGASVRPLPK
jgi:hypothetical protein